MAPTDPKVWLDYTQAELDDQYNQRILVPDANDYMALTDKGHLTRHGAGRGTWYSLA